VHALCAAFVLRDLQVVSLHEMTLLHDIALAAAGRLARILALFDLSYHELEGLLDILVVSSAGLGPGTLEFCGEGAAVFGGDLTLLGT
jgi:hypothetical protein